MASSSIEEAVDHALKAVGKENIRLKKEQFDILKLIVLETKDVLAVLPTGFGKSLIYQTIAPFADFIEPGKSIVLVISPLNALIKDQVTRLRKTGLKTCILKADRVASDCQDMEEVSVTSSDELQNLSHFQLIYAHPEALVESRQVLKLLKQEEFQNRIRAIVVDEAHLVVDWKDFRPCYGKLGILGSIFPKVPWLGLTATATKKTRTDIIESLGMFNPTEIVVNPDRPNIYFSSSARPDRGYEKLNDILRPLVDQLKSERTEFPLTVVFGNLETISMCFAFFNCAMGKEQYEPVGAPPRAENRLFTQFHAQYPAKEKERIVEGLTLGTSKLRIIFATVAFGIGLDLKNIRQVIHIGVPCSMEEYFQEAGRAGRDGLPSKAHVYFNSYDISKARKNQSQVMKEYVKDDKCKREMIMGYFGFEPLPPRETLHECCDYHVKHCKCEDCLLSQMVSLIDTPLEQTPTQACFQKEPFSDLSVKKKRELYEELVNFRLSLPGHGRTTVGSTSLSSGVTIELIGEIVDKARTFSSTADIEQRLPIFSHHHAVSIWNIVKEYTQKDVCV